MLVSLCDWQPFGEGLITVVVPQLRRGDNSLLLWNINDVSAPVHTFVGHQDVILEFQWRKAGDGEYDVKVFVKKLYVLLSLLIPMLIKMLMMV